MADALLAAPASHIIPTTFSSSKLHHLTAPLGTVASPPIKPRTARRPLLKRRRRTMKSSSTYGDDEEAFGFFSGDGGGGGSPFGGGGGGGSSSGGGGWWERWGDESSASADSDPAFDQVYEVLCWIVFSNCVHFAVKRIGRLVVLGFVRGNGKVRLG
ncbi:hypothetical protein Droror1_Dr00007830 [Drosera rotundifolia]